MNILKFLQGKKTYILVACALAVGALDLTGVIDDNAANTALTFLGFGGLATLRAGIVNALAQAKEAGTVAAPVVSAQSPAEAAKPDLPTT